MENKDKVWNEHDDEVEIIEVVFEYIRHWKWFLVSLIVCLGIGLTVFIITPKQYKSSISILLEEDKSGNRPAMDMEMLSQGLFSTTSNIENEIAILSSPDLMKIVIDTLNLQSSYYTSNNFRKIEMYEQSPFLVKHNTSSPYSFGKADLYILKENGKFVIGGVYITLDGTEFVIEEKNESLPHMVNIEGTDIQFSFSQTGKVIDESEKYYVEVRSLSTTSKLLATNLNVSTTSKTSSVLDINLLVNNVQKGNAILEELIRQYNLMNVRIKNQMAYNTALFINERLVEISRELGEAEEGVVEYKQEHKITDLSTEAQLFVQQTGENEKKILDIETQINVLSFAEKFVNSPENNEKIIPNLGLADIGLSQIITEYNNKLIGADALIKSTGLENPARVRVLEELTHMRGSISNSLENVKQTYNVSKRDFLRQARSTQTRIVSVPKQERGLVEKVREQQIKENLFIFLMQKREENNLAIASTPDKARVIVSPEKIVLPTSPKFTILILGAMILGVLIPIIGIYLVNLFKTQIGNRAELEKLSTVNIIGEIAHNKSKMSTILKHHNDGAAEMFRALRNNLNFVLGNKQNQTLLTTSTMSGEGKTYVSTNLALSYAFTGNKVLLIGADIRNPQIARYFPHLDRQRGLTDYLTSSSGDWKNYIHDSRIDENLHVMVAGTIPPHPNELLMTPRLKEILKEVRQEYDFVILDTAPVGMVSDTYLINEHIDLTVYVTREGITPKSAVNFINVQKEEGRLHNMYLVLNDTKAGKDYRYGYGKTYGYGNKK